MKVGNALRGVPKIPYKGGCYEFKMESGNTMKNNPKEKQKKHKSQKKQNRKRHDTTSRALEAHNDVFADIVNVLLFNGKPVIKEDELEDGTVHSSIMADNAARSQERDVVKYWKKGAVRICFLGLENQTKIDEDMPLRVISYDGAAYKSQLLDRKKAERYPVVTLI